MKAEAINKTGPAKSSRKISKAKQNNNITSFICNADCSSANGKGRHYRNTPRNKNGIYIQLNINH